jgi:hypothetical protein
MERALLVAILLSGAVSLAGTSASAPAAPETPFDTAKRLAASKEPKDRVQALGMLRTLGQPGRPEGDEALARYADLCMRFLAEGEKNALPEAKRAFGELKEKSHSGRGGGPESAPAVAESSRHGLFLSALTAARYGCILRRGSVRYGWSGAETEAEA